MSATAAQYAGCNQKAFLRNTKAFINDKVNAPQRPVGLYAFDSGAVTIPTASKDEVGDEFFVLRFPSNCTLLHLNTLFTDMDTHATPTMTVDIITSNTGALSGSEVTLKAASTAAQTGTYESLGGLAQDVSDLYLGIKIAATAATAAAGSVRFRGLVFLGDIPVSG